MAIVRIMAFDPGVANTGYGSLVLDTEAGNMELGDAWGTLHTSPDQKDRERIETIGHESALLIKKYMAHHVGIEGWTFMGNRGKQESQMPYLVEHLHMTAQHLGRTVHVLENGEWKKKTLGIRGANKDQVKDYVTRCLPRAVHTLRRAPNHVWDAVGICLCIAKGVQ